MTIAELRALLAKADEEGAYIGDAAVDALPALLDVAEAAKELFAALDYLVPSWRKETFVDDGDESNVAWNHLHVAIAKLETP